MPTRTTHRSAASAGRFGRQATTPNRFGRPAPTPNRFGRTATPAPRFASGRRRQPAKKSIAQHMMSAVPGLSKGSSKRRRSSGGGRGRKRAGGMALLAGGLGLAMKNRDKIGGLLGRHSSDTGQTPPAAAPPPAAPPAV
ncbi:MAG TPA: hypothetical protein VGO71_18640 [Baekduia sp.]|jgi:hypothetical protein|nr:hypothetical protein [Baekduia sp.]